MLMLTALLALMGFAAVGWQGI
ncbi:MAG: hypothetical protein EHM38_00160 [Geobacteraceae bacterium]|nr:MAG: hypothetical protein EHM38_04465 [Geobacteraceae bacterium]RPI72088.1 MAG: hypothetical protein EHM38_02650 [Geobacteraceae bacterium]RPI73546.1 MAG: hypothetical protein EHM38_00160 [Geobacteraceae bacterium]